MSTTLEQPLLTPDDFLSHPDRDRCELVDGQLVETNMSMESVWIQGQVYQRIDQFVRQHRLGMTFTDGLTYRCFAGLEEDPDRIRRPDCSFIRAGRTTSDQFVRGHCEIVPDLVVEVVSPKDSYYDIQQRVHEFLRVGCPLVWVINPNSRMAAIYHKDGSVVEIDEHANLVGEDVLPGFQCRLADVLPPAKLPDVL
jgi:Uma2 family endonuclease